MLDLKKINEIRKLMITHFHKHHYSTQEAMEIICGNLKTYRGKNKNGKKEKNK